MNSPAKQRNAYGTKRRRTIGDAKIRGVARFSPVLADEEDVMQLVDARLALHAHPVSAVVEAVSVDFAVVLPGVIGLQLATIPGRDGCWHGRSRSLRAEERSRRETTLPLGIAFIIDSGISCGGLIESGNLAGARKSADRVL